ncbi:MAG: maltose alpha-D-glucosyltransferase [Gemmataceae bacterium]|nr:maltose alpha-D-glucosyltransferase [Gemmataceae bacterium]
MLSDDPLWYKDAIIYELHVRSFHDSDGDGIGDFKGLTQKLDYLQDLGVTAIWLLPFYPSPLKDDGYDIADYTDINPSYGTLADFKEFLDAAHARGLRVITELVINHTSDQHPWFQRARRSPPGSVERNFYVWSDTPEKYKEARIIFKDFEPSNWTWDPVAKAYYWHRFYSHQPDLNFDNPAVWDALFPVLDFWMDLGVDGMRLDAIPYLYEREGTNCENLPETHAFLKALRRHMDAKYQHRIFLSEANQWPEDAAAYFGDGDETHMAFHFPLMPRLYMAIHMEDRFPIVDIMDQTPPIPENCQWCLFLRNHDELTLEMVTDEERDYMYRAYAADPRARINLGIRHRLAPLLGNNRRRIELLNGLLFSLPGTPVVYYGDEIGMGDNIYLGDRNGVRTPMQWSADRNAGFSRANPQRLFLPVIIDPEYHYEAVNVDAQQNNTNSLLWWMKWLIALRKRHRAFGRGSLEFLHPANRKVLAYLRCHDGETILVVANLSRFVQPVELDLGRFPGATPIELFGQNPFPVIGKDPYPLTLGPHSFLWFVLQPQAPAVVVEQPKSLFIRSLRRWEELFAEPYRERLEEHLADYLPTTPWLGRPARSIKSVKIVEAVPLRFGETSAYVCLLFVEFRDGEPERFLLPLAWAQGEAAERCKERQPACVAAVLQGGLEGVVYDALATPEFAAAVLDAIAERRRFRLPFGEVRAVAWSGGTPLRRDAAADALAILPHRDGPTHTSFVFGDRFILKMFRRVEGGTHPDVEVCRFLAERGGFPSVAPLLGMVELQARGQEPMTLAVLHGFVPSEGNAWQYTVDELSRYFERVLALTTEEQAVPVTFGSLLDLADAEPPSLVVELIGRYLESARLLGERTAQLHRALAADAESPAFAPEPFGYLYQRSLYQSMRTTYLRALDSLRDRVPELPEADREEAHRLLHREMQLARKFRTLLLHRIAAQRIRIHGDYQLHELLYTGKDFVIVDFEGPRWRPLADRRIKRSPLRDVAAMIRSFDEAAYSALLPTPRTRGHVPGIVRPEDVDLLEPWAWTWFRWVSATFLKSYLTHADADQLLPAARDDRELLLELFILEHAFLALNHELSDLKRWTGAALRSIQRQLEPRSMSLTDSLPG